MEVPTLGIGIAGTTDQKRCSHLATDCVYIREVYCFRSPKHATRRTKVNDMDLGFIGINSTCGFLNRGLVKVLRGIKARSLSANAHDMWLNERQHPLRAERQFENLDAYLKETFTPVGKRKDA